MADRLALFSVVIGFALLLSGVGFIVLDFAALNRRRAAAEAADKRIVIQPGKPVTV